MQCSADAQTKWPGYVQRDPSTTLLYQTVHRYYSKFVEHHGGPGCLPAFVHREFEGYLRCGLFPYGFARCLCSGCGLEHPVAFSCKRRGFCPRCIGRRMNDVAARLVDRVLPEVAYRQWVCTLPWSLRARVGYDRHACAEFVRAFAHGLSQQLSWQAKRELGVSSVTAAYPGLLVFVQRGDSALRFNPHLHVVCTDGVYVRDSSGALVFERLPPPSDQMLGQVAQHTAHRVQQALSFEVDQDDVWTDDEPLLAHCYGHSSAGRVAIGKGAGNPTVRLLEGRARTPRRFSGANPRGPMRVEVDGFGVYADTPIEAQDRAGLERLCRYLARPPLCNDRLHRHKDGLLGYRLKRPWADGTSAIVLHPLDLIARLCALIGPPRFHTLRFFGVFSAHAKLRPLVVPSPEHQPPVAQLRLPLFPEADAAPTKRPTRTPWAKLLARVFAVDVSICPRCQGPMRIVQFVTEPEDPAAALPGLARAPPQPEPFGQLSLCIG